MVTRLLGHSVKKRWKEPVNHNSGLKKQSRKIVIDSISNGKAMIIH